MNKNLFILEQPWYSQILGVVLCAVRLVNNADGEVRVVIGLRKVKSKEAQANIDQ